MNNLVCHEFSEDGLFNFPERDAIIKEGIFLTFEELEEILDLLKQGTELSQWVFTEAEANQDGMSDKAVMYRHDALDLITRPEEGRK